MKHLLANIGVNLVAMACVAGAIYMVINGITGWGWFLFVGILCAGSINIKDGK